MGAEGQDPAAVPLHSMSYALYCNKKMFQEAGVEKPPATWDEMAETDRKLSKDGTWALGAEGSNLSNSIHQVFALSRQHGGNFFDASGKPDLTSDADVAAVKQYVDLMGKNKIIAPGNAEYAQIQPLQDFARGKTAMVLWQSAASTFKAHGMKNEDRGVAPAPVQSGTLAAARRMDGHTNRWWLDPVHGRGFPADMTEVYGVDLPERAGDLATIAQPLDWLGLNHYFPAVVTDDPHGPYPFARRIRRPGVPRTGMDWEIDAGGIETLLMRLTEEYGARRVRVTENGSAHPDAVLADGTIDECERAQYLREHLAACARAAQRGAPLAGYYAWSLLDNFEWAYGYDKRFGLVHVDYGTQRRTIKGSGRHYAGIIRGHRTRGARAA
ncbi:family 1 glycosylhydrolase [Streptomyces sp. Wb2n-11]|uniref:family 1 glycosylhydrolase n=1 Tax=Streptomyces sp. Wb2n-11 TaxID=1030533 RepID=UPI000A812F4D|nr:family 1 glycosylhydrolase [Streptomyces sp. Wb2n-11]